MWHIIRPEQQERSRKAFEEQAKAAAKESEEKRKAREAHEANRCPHCGRNDPLPPWLM